VHDRDTGDGHEFEELESILSYDVQPDFVAIEAGKGVG